MDLQGRSWLTRGHSLCWKGLVPSIDRKPHKGLGRAEKLQREQRRVDQFHATARFFSSLGEELALRDDIATLMVLRHCGVPTRLVDWSASPYVATYFAVCADERKDGEIWAFSYRDYVTEGKKQWKKWPWTTTDGSGDDDKFAAGLTAFSIAEPPDSFIAAFYPPGFPRQNAQRGLYTMTARFGVDHAEALRKLLVDESRYHRYVVKANIKEAVRESLQNDHGIRRGSLFPDSAGAAATASEAFTRPCGGV